MDLFLQQLVNGLTLGAIYALIAVGYTMVYGVLKLINFAHGEVFMIGAMTSYYVANALGLYDGRNAAGEVVSGGGPISFVIVLLAAAAVCAVLGLAIEFFAYRPLRNQTRLTALITAIGVSLLLQYGGQLVFSPNPRAFPKVWPWIEGQAFAAGEIVVSRVDILVLLMTLAFMAGLTYVIKFTRPGLALRAVSHRFDTAGLMGVNVNRAIAFTFVLGSILAAAGGLLYAIKFPSIDPLMGLTPGIKAFIAAVLGGIGNIVGAVLGAVLLGLVEMMVVGFVDGGSQYREAVAFVVLIGILLVKPTGLMGSTAVEKV